MSGQRRVKSQLHCCGEEMGCRDSRPYEKFTEGCEGKEFHFIRRRRYRCEVCNNAVTTLEIAYEQAVALAKAKMSLKMLLNSIERAKDVVNQQEE